MDTSKRSVNTNLDELWPIMEEQLNAGGSVTFGPKGISMLPMLRQGIDSVVLEKPKDRLKKYDVAFFRRVNGNFVLHRVIKVTKDGYVMRGDNQTHNEKGVLDNQILAVLTGFYRGEEYHSIKEEEYIKYSKKQVAKQNIKRIEFAIRRVGSKVKRKIIKR